MSQVEKPTDDNLITRRKNITKGIEEIRAKKGDIAKALRDLGVSNEEQKEQNKDFIKQLVEAYDTLSNQENQYLDILKTIVNIHEQATLDIAKDFEEKIKEDEKKLKEKKEQIEAANLPPVERTEEEIADMNELQEALLELKKVSEAAVAASELNDKLVEKLQLHKKKKNAMMEIRTQKAKGLDEEAKRVRSEVMEKINKMSSLKKSTGQQEKELEDLRKQCLQMGLIIGSNDNHQVGDDARRAVNDNSQRVPALPELDEEEKEKRRKAIRENIAKEVEQKEQVNSLIREKLAAMEARKKRLQQIRKQLDDNHKAEELLAQSSEQKTAPIATGEEVPAEVEEQVEKVENVEKVEKEEDGEEAVENSVPANEEDGEVELMEHSLDAILDNAKANLNNLTAMRERLEEIQQNGGKDLSEDDITLLHNLDQVVDLEKDIKSAVQESFNAVFQPANKEGETTGKVGETAIIEARLVTIETMVRQNNIMLNKQQHHYEAENQSRRLASLAPGVLRELASRLALLADLKEKYTCNSGESPDEQEKKLLAVEQLSRDISTLFFEKKTTE